MTNECLSPIVLFVYNRISHTKQTIDALQKNKLANKSHLYIYSDGFKDENDKTEVLGVREYIKTVTGFKKVTIIEQLENRGLAESIITGVTEIVNKYENIIVLEDDIVTSPYFLTFMNNALNYYKDNKKIWHISGWNYPLKDIINEDTFMWRMMNCWGWATWKDRWQFYEKSPQSLINKYSEYDIYKFNLDGSTGGFWSQVLNNNNGIMDTWAIFWYAAIFNNNGLCLNPTQSYVENIGFDGTGTNTGVRNNYSSPLGLKEEVKFTNNYFEDDYMLFSIKNFLSPKNKDNIVVSKNIVFSKNINKVQQKLYSLDQSKEYVLYGAGTGARLILSFFSHKIKYIIDKNSKIQNSKLEDKNILLPYGNTKSYNIIISVFGRENSIQNFLINECNVNSNNITTFEL